MFCLYFPWLCRCILWGLQVYNEQIYDLLDEQGVGPLAQRAALRLKEDAMGRVFVAGLSEVSSRGVAAAASTEHI